MLFLPGHGELSLEIWDDTCNFSYERFITEIVPQNHFNKEETHIHNTINIFNQNPRVSGSGRNGGNVRSRNVRAGNGRGGIIKDCGDVVEVHVNNLKQCVRDHIESQIKRGYQPKGIYPQDNGNYRVVTKKGKQTFTRTFIVNYF